MATSPEDNGILALIRGEEISEGMRLLPKPDDDPPSPQHAEVQTLYQGRVRITYRLASHSRGKSRRWFWVACHAEPKPIG